MKIGLVDDDPSVIDLLMEQLEFENIVKTTDFKSARKWIQTSSIDCLVSDLKLDDGSGMDLLKETKQKDEPIEVIIMTGFGSVDSAVEAMKEGARDYLQKPVEVDELQLILERVEEERATRTKLEGFRAARDSEEQDLLIGHSEVMKELRDKINKIAEEPVNVLIKGSTGTGKELIARELHRHSNRYKSPFIAVNCAAIPGNLLESELFGHVKGAFTGASESRRGKIELADSGTVFLDEIGELPLELQPKLLRALEQEEITRIGGESPRQVDVRFVSATNRDLDSMLEAEEFRKDLYYRLQTIELTSPDLKDHTEDIPLLVDHFLEEMAGERFQELFCSDDVYKALEDYHWPGNVRELRNIVERAAVLSEDDKIRKDDLPPEVTESKDTSSFGTGWWKQYGDSLDEVVTSVEKEIIDDVLKETDGNKSEAARRLGISRQNLHYKIGNND